MTKITTYNRGIIIDGHADTKEECETITLLCNSLAKDENFKQVAYDDGYAAFEKIGKAERLRFIKTENGLTVYFDTGIQNVGFSYGSNTYTFTTSGETYGFTAEPGSDITLTVNLKSGYSLKSSSIGSVSGNTVTIPFSTVTTNNTSLTCTLVSEAASSKLSVDLTTLSGWANLSAGNHTIKLKAKGTGYKDSELSTGVTVSKAASTVTLSAGTYKWKDSVTLTDIAQDIEFTSNNTQYAIIKSSELRAVITYTTSYAAAVYNNGSWTDNAYKTITLATDQQVSQEFYKWAITDGNLVKQATGETWLLNETLTESNQDFTSLNFTSNSQSFVRIVRQYDNRPTPPANSLLYYKSDGTYVTAVYANDDGVGTWNNQAYRTLTFETAPTGDLLTWLQANGVKQTTAYKVTLSLDGDPGYIPTPIDLYQCDDDKGTNKELLTTITSSADDNKVITVTKAYLYYLGAYGGYTKIDGDMTFHITWDSCLTGDTLVTMLDKSEKRLDEIEVGDKVLSVDFDMKQHIVSEVIYTDKDTNKQHTEYDLWIFSDGTEIKTVHRHEFYNLEAKRMEYMDEWKIGEHTLKVDGTHPALVEHKTVKEVVKHYKITLDGNTAYFANGLLTGDRHCPKDKAL